MPNIISIGNEKEQGQTSGWVLVDNGTIDSSGSLRLLENTNIAQYKQIKCYIMNGRTVNGNNLNVYLYLNNGWTPYFAFDGDAQSGHFQVASSSYSGGSGEEISFSFTFYNQYVNCHSQSTYAYNGYTFDVEILNKYLYQTSSYILPTGLTSGNINFQYNRSSAPFKFFDIISYISISQITNPSYSYSAEYSIYGLL